MSDAAALLAAIRAAPDDDAPRLVYADWLEEHGQPEWAEFIRVQCELARLDSQALRRREAELLGTYHDIFAGPLAVLGLRFRFHRGFVSTFGHTGVFAQRNPAEQLPNGRVLSPWHRLLRFHPDGRVQEATTRGDYLTEASGLFEPGGACESGTYVFNTELSPPGLQFSLTLSNAATIDYRGRLKGRSLFLERTVRIEHHPAQRLRFAHRIIPGLDSRPES